MSRVAWQCLSNELKEISSFAQFHQFADGDSDKWKFRRFVAHICSSNGHWQQSMPDFSNDKVQMKAAIPLRKNSSNRAPKPEIILRHQICLWECFLSSRKNFDLAAQLFSFGESNDHRSNGRSLFQLLRWEWEFCSFNLMCRDKNENFFLSVSCFATRTRIVHAENRD